MIGRFSDNDATFIESVLNDGNNFVDYRCSIVSYGRFLEIEAEISINHKGIGTSFGGTVYCLGNKRFGATGTFSFGEYELIKKNEGITLFVAIVERRLLAEIFEAIHTTRKNEDPRFDVEIDEFTEHTNEFDIELGDGLWQPE